MLEYQACTVQTIYATVKIAVLRLELILTIKGFVVTSRCYFLELHLNF